MTLMAFATLGVMACSSETDETETDRTDTTQTEVPVEPAPAYQGNITPEQTNQLVAAYLETKDALVEDDMEGAQGGARNVMKALEEVSMDATLESIRTNAQEISEADKIEVQRQHFKTLSEEIYQVAKSIPSGIELYKEYCPMAFDNEGAYWISQNKEIYNPYFGASMLRCGKVEETIAAE